MRHSYFGTKLSRTKNERRQLLRGLVRSMMLYGEIKTTKAKAKAIQSLVERMIGKAKVGSEQAKRELYKELDSKQAIAALLDQAKTRFVGRSSGYTRIIKIGSRIGDRANVVLLSFVDPAVVMEVIAPKTKTVPAPKKDTAPKKVVKKEPVKKAAKTKEKNK